MNNKKCFLPVKDKKFGAFVSRLSEAQLRQSQGCPPPMQSVPNIIVCNYTDVPQAAMPTGECSSEKENDRASDIDHLSKYRGLLKGKKRISSQEQYSDDDAETNRKPSSKRSCLR